jgi:hypothetical protein
MTLPSSTNEPSGAQRTAPSARTAIAVVVLGFWGLLFEFGVRVEDWVRYQTPLLSPFNSQGQLMVRDADGIHGRPNSRFRKWVLNNEGMRGPDVTRSKALGILRVVTVGASETFGLYESQGREYPRQLEDSLEAMRRDGRCRCVGIKRFEVLNAGLLGMSLPTVAQDIRSRIGRFAPDAVVLYPSPVQYLEENAPKRALPDSSGLASKPLGLGGALYPRSIGRLREQLKISLPTIVKDILRQREADLVRSARPADWQFRAIPVERINAYETDLRGSIDAINELGAVPLVVSHANAFRKGEPRDKSLLTAWGKFYPRADPPIIVAFDDSAAATTRRVALEASAIFVDWHTAASSKSGSVFQDFSHMTDYGSGILAGLLAQEIVRWSNSSIERMKPKSDAATH